jgi:transcription termination factor NusB
MLERRRARHQALHILYQREITEQPLSRILSEGTFSVEDGERMPLVDRNILRLAVFEMLYRDEDVPDSVAINEAVEMAKVYGGEDSSKFVNGVLGRLADQAGEGGLEESNDE